jgi:hypothetical protein
VLLLLLLLRQRLLLLLLLLGLSLQLAGGEVNAPTLDARSEAAASVTVSAVRPTL